MRIAIPVINQKIMYLAISFIMTLTLFLSVMESPAQAATFSSSSYYNIVNVNSGKNLDVYGGQTADGANVIQYHANGGLNQNWQLVDLGNGYYKVANQKSGKVLDVYQKSTADGGNIVQWTDNGGTNQQWQIVDMGGGVYKFANRNSGKVLDIANMSTADGANVQQWTAWSGGTNQEWKVVAVGTGSNNGLVGFATLNGGTTGGSGGTVVHVSTGTALQNALNNKSSGTPLIIYVDATITPGNSTGLTKFDVKDESDISILGSGSGAEFSGIGIKLTRAHNVIIRNLKIHNVDIGDKDAIGMQYSTNVWVDHNEFYSDLDHGKDYYDGLVDITHASDFVTVSWNNFHDHYKVSLAGHSDSNGSEDTGHLRVTYHHNAFENVSSRLPSMRFGKGHVFDNYYYNVSTSGINSRMGAQMRIENNDFESVADPIVSLDSSSIGYWEVHNNLFNNCTGNQPTTSTTSYAPPYSYTLDAASNVKSIVLQGAGIGKISP